MLFAETNPQSGDAVTAVFSRSGRLGHCDSMTIPFVHPRRPTVYLEAGCVTLPMLFDSGTYLSIFIDDGQFISPGLNPVPYAELLAGADGKLPLVGYDNEPTYGFLDLAKLGGVRIRDVPFRIYSGSGDLARDYAGAVAPALFGAYIVEVRNSRTEISLHHPPDWGPPESIAVMPLLLLPRGSFVAMRIAGESWWFHLDTGFSGSIGLLPALCERHPQWIERGQGEELIYQGLSLIHI